MCRDACAALHTPCDALPLLKPNPQRRPLVPGSRRTPQCAAGGARGGTRFPAHGWLLQGALPSARVVTATVVGAEQPAAAPAGAYDMGLAWPRGQDRGWFSRVDARHGSESTGVSPAWEPGTRPRFPGGPDRGRVVLSLRRGMWRSVGASQGQEDE